MCERKKMEKNERATNWNGIKHIVIIHKRFEEEIFELFSSFFRTCGIYVQEYVLENITRKDDLDYHCFVVVLNDAWNEYTEAYKDNDNWISINFRSLRTENTINDQINILYELIDKFPNVRRKTEYSQEQLISIYEDTRCLKSLADIFVNNNLLYDSYRIRMIVCAKTQFLEESTMIINHYQSALSELSQLGIEFSSPYVIYFMFECKRKMNMTCQLSNRENVFLANSLVIDLREKIELYPKFTTMWTLYGLLAENDIYSKTDSIKYYSNQITQDRKFGNKEDERFHAYNYYRIGRYLQKNVDAFSLEKECYIRAYKLDKNNYRFLYKVAFIYEKEGDYSKAVECYRMIADEIEMYVNQSYITVGRCEYLHKVCLKIFTICRKYLKQYILAKRYGELLIRFYNEIDNNTFLDEFYDRKTSLKIRSSMKEHLSIDEIINDMPIVDRLISTIGK